MRFFSFLCLALISTAAPTLAAPQYLHRMVTHQYTTTRPPTTEAPTYAPTTEAPTTYPPTTEAPTYPPTTDAPTTYAPTTDAPTTYAPTTYAPTTYAPTTYAPTTYAPTYTATTSPPTEYGVTDAPTDTPTGAAPTSWTWCYHVLVTSSSSYSDVTDLLTAWMDAFLASFGLGGVSSDYLSFTPVSADDGDITVGNCTVYDTNVDVYVRITLPSEIYHQFASLYDHYVNDTPIIIYDPVTYTCAAPVHVDHTCYNAQITPTASAGTQKPTSSPTNTTKAPTTAPTGASTTQAPTSSTTGNGATGTKTNTTTAPTSSPTQSTITITTNVTEPDPNTRCVAGVCVTFSGASNTRVAAVPIIASMLALALAVF